VGGNERDYKLSRSCVQVTDLTNGRTEGLPRIQLVASLYCLTSGGTGGGMVNVIVRAVGILTRIERLLATVELSLQ
jgi:hypothetical protein